MKQLQSSQTQVALAPRLGQHYVSPQTCQHRNKETTRHLGQRVGDWFQSAHMILLKSRLSGPEKQWWPGKAGLKN